MTSLPNHPAALLEALDLRRSVPSKQLGLPGPDEAAILRMLRSAVRVPDHGKRTPFRFLRIQGSARHALGARLAERSRERDPNASDAVIEKDRHRFDWAPVILTVIAKIGPDEKIPAQERLLSAGCVCFALLQAAQGLGFGAQWLTGWAAYDPVIARSPGHRCGRSHRRLHSYRYRRPRRAGTRTPRPRRSVIRLVACARLGRSGRLSGTGDENPPRVLRSAGRRRRAAAVFDRCQHLCLSRLAHDARRVPRHRRLADERGAGVRALLARCAGTATATAYRCRLRRSARYVFPQSSVPGLQSQSRARARRTQAPVFALQSALPGPGLAGIGSFGLRSGRFDRRRAYPGAHTRPSRRDSVRGQRPVAVITGRRRAVGLRPQPALGRAWRTRTPWRGSPPNRGLSRAQRRCGGQHPRRARHRRENRRGVAGALRRSR